MRLIISSNDVENLSDEQPIDFNTILVEKEQNEE
jgi:hypothetical protein